MEAYFKRIRLTALDKYEVADSNGNLLFDIRAELVSAGNSYRINDASGKEVANIHRKKLSVRDKYVIDTRYEGSTDVFRIDTMRKVPEYRAKQKGWTLKGDFSKKSLRIMEGLHTVCEIRPKMLSFKDVLKIDVKKDEDLLMVVALLLVSEADLSSKPENAGVK